MSTKHTPGPWKIVRKFGGVGVAIQADGHIRPLADIKELEYEQGNARLIAAAPEMLEALYAIEALACQQFTESEIESLEDLEPIRIARAAIARAEGRE